MPGIALGNSYQGYLSAEFSLFGKTSISLILNLGMLGFAFLINRDIALGFWFFFLLSSAQRDIFNTLGIHSNEQLSRFANLCGPYLAHQAMGAMIVLVLSGLWIARTHIRAVFGKAFGKDSTVDDTDEVLSYRTAVFGLLVGLIFLSLWLWKSGLPLWVIPIFLLAVFIIFTALTRTVTEGGLAAIRTPITPSDFVISGIGTTALGPSGLVSLAFTWIWGANIRIFFMATFANALKLVEELGTKRKALVGALTLAVLVTMVGSIWTLMFIAYRNGGVNLHSFYFLSVPRNAFTYIAPMLATSVPANLAGWFFTGLGALLMSLLTLARHRFVWWPVHPLGFATGTFFIMNYIWFSVFLAWLLKSIVLRYGGASFYRRARPFFLGLILGQISVAGLWIAIDFFTGMIGNQPIGKSQL